MTTAQHDFLALALEVAQATCPTAHPVPADFQILLPHATWNLAQSFGQLRHRPPSEQRHELDKMVQALLTVKPLPTNPSALRALLVPRVSSLSILLRNAHANGWDPSTTSAPFFQLDWFLGIDVVARDGDVLHHVVHRLHEWDLTLRDVLTEARRQHPARRYPEQPSPTGAIEAGVISGDLLIFDLDRGNQGVLLTIPQPPGSLVLLCTQTQVYRAHENHPSDVDALLRLAEEAYPTDPAVCLVPYVTPELQDPSARLPMVPWHPGPGHPQAPRLERLRQMQHYRDWSLLRPVLIQREIERGNGGTIAHHVASMTLMDHPTNISGFTTSTTWSAAGGILPNYAGEVVVVPEGSTTAYFLAGATVYEVLQEVAHALPNHAGLAWLVEGGLPESHHHILSLARATIELGATA